ncbi:hypothetical protein [Krasilnikovia sp. MM14-A1004]|uniref:hypothetical protein n=1 Tax=Krasilnikovia sp. MM14-A1004 TaxID=3373541 RepID=UPI00399CC891
MPGQATAPQHPAAVPGQATAPGYPASAPGLATAPGYVPDQAVPPVPSAAVSQDHPDSGAPYTGWTPTSDAGPSSWDDNRFGFDAPMSRGPRIEPSPPPDRRRVVLGLLVGLLVGLLLFGTGGWFAGRATAPAAAPTPAAPSATPSAEPTLGAYEQSQIAINQPKLSGALAPVAQDWLPHLSGCARSGERNGPNLSRGEKARVRCELDAMTIVFVEFNSAADRDKGQVRALGQNVDARQLAPGVAEATKRATPSGRMNGNYVEYAYKVTEGGGDRVVSGIWWDDAQAPVAAYLLAYWKEGIGEKWEPMRDLWSRYA